MTSGANAKLYLNLIGYPYDRELNGPATADGVLDRVR